VLFAMRPYAKLPLYYFIFVVHFLGLIVHRQLLFKMACVLLGSVVMCFTIHRHSKQWLLFYMPPKLCCRALSSWWVLLPQHEKG